MAITQLTIFLALTLAVTCKCTVYKTKAEIKVVYRGGLIFECPHWSVTENALYWSDMVEQKLYRMDGATKRVTKRSIAHGILSAAIPVKDYPKILLAAVRTGIYLLPWDSYTNDTSLRFISSVDFGLPDNKINEGKCDPKGRLWIGTKGKQVDGVIDPDRASLYMVDQYNYRNPDVKVRSVSISNGMAWSGNGSKMFYNDSPTRKISVFDFELETGNIRNRRTLFDFDTYNLTGVPDGMTIDTDDNLWVACFNGYKVIKIDSNTGCLLETFDFPAKKMTSVMFGGPGLCTLFVTSSRLGLSPEEAASQPDAGSLFAIEGTGSRGRPENQFVFPNAANY